MAYPEPANETEILADLEWTEFENNGIYVASFLTLAGAVGTLGNIAVFLVYCFKMRHTTYRVYVLFLSSVDFFGCTLSIPFVIMELRYQLLFSSSDLCKVSRMTIYFLATMSLCLLDIIAMERLWIISRPLGHKTSPTGAALICFITGVFVFCTISIPAAFIYGSDQRPASVETVVGCECTVYQYLERPLSGIIYQIGLVGIFTFLFMLCIITYSCIHRKLKHAMVKGETLREHCQYDGSDRRVSNDSTLSETISVDDSTDLVKDKLAPIGTWLNGAINSVSVTQNVQDSEKAKMAEILNGNIENNLNKNKKRGSFTASVKSSSNVSLSKTEKGNKKVKRSCSVRRGMNVTGMFLVISAVSFGTSLPYFILAAIRNMKWEVFFRFDEDFGPLDEFLTSLMFLNHAINPIIYGFMDKKFRNGFLQIYNSLSRPFRIFSK